MSTAEGTDSALVTDGWLDTPQRYERVSRAFHWLMAALFAWQFAGALLYVATGYNAVTRIVGGSHFTLGFTLFVLVLLRGAWGLANLTRRPPHQGRLGRAAVTGHLLIYALMVVVPGLALLRQYGSGKPFTPYGIPLMSGRGDKVAWMVASGDSLHHWLAFTLLVVLVGHVVMTFLHRKLRKEDVPARMT